MWKGGRPVNCAEFQNLLDGYIDGELDAIRRAEFEAHAAKCASCGEALRAAEQLRDFLAHMDDDLAVPLPAQAAWRKAVRAEARRRRLKRVYAACGAAAAVCLVAIGAASALRSNPVASEGRPEAVAYVEADGISDEAALEDPVARMSGAEESAAIAYVDRTVLSEDAVAARKYLSDIVAEYGGAVAYEADVDEGVRVYVQIPGQSAADFLRAVDHLGVEPEEELPALDEAAEIVGICVIVAQI